MTVTSTPSSVLEASVAGLRIQSLTWGTGPAVVVLHRSTGSTGWTPFLADLATDHLVLAPDLPGFGTSDRPEWARHPRDLAVLIGHWIQQVAEGPATVVGLGFGGWVAAELATLRPEVVRSLLLVGAAGLVPERGRILDQVLISHMEYVRAAFHDDGRFAELFGEVPSDEQLLAWDRNREMMARVTWKPYMHSRQLAGLLGTISAPTVAVWGDDDRVVPRECGERYAREIADARLEVVAGSGHAVDIEQPARLAALVRGLTTTAGATRPS
jgi:pimeloyl-ACP methyl ester carboxylesterase